MSSSKDLLNVMSSSKALLMGTSSSKAHLKVMSPSKALLKVTSSSKALPKVMSSSKALLKVTSSSRALLKVTTSSQDLLKMTSYFKESIKTNMNNPPGSTEKRRNRLVGMFQFFQNMNQSGTTSKIKNVIFSDSVPKGGRGSGLNHTFRRGFSENHFVTY